MIGKIRRLFNKLGKKYTEYAKKYLLTNIGLIVLTFYSMIIGLESGYNSVVFKSLMMFVCINFLVETTYKKDNKKRLYLYILSVFLSILISFLCNFNDVRLVLVFFGINLILLFIGLYQIIKNKKDISNYASKVFFNLFKVELFTMILLVGFGIIYAIMLILIIDGYSVEFYSKLVLFIIGVYNIPFTIISIDNVSDDVPDIIHTLINRVLLVLLDTSFIVILIYVIKILVTGSIPQNQVFAIVLLLFMFAYPMIILLGNYDGKIEKFNVKYLPYVFVIPVLLQMHSLFLRIDTYGVTNIRYLGIYIIIVEVVSIILLLIKDKKYFKYLFIFLAVLIYVLFISPFSNLYEAPIMLQVNRLTSIWTENTSENDITKDERQVIKDIYDYLKDEQNADSFMPKYLSLEKINKYLMNTRDKYDGELSQYYSYVNKNESIDVKEFSTFKHIRYGVRSVDINEGILEIEDDTFNIKEDVDDFIRVYYDNYSYDKEIMFYSETGKVFVVETMSFYYNGNMDSLDNFELEGYLLYR